MLAESQQSNHFYSYAMVALLLLLGLVVSLPKLEPAKASRSDKSSSQPPVEFHSYVPGLDLHTALSDPTFGKTANKVSSSINGASRNSINTSTQTNSFKFPWPAGLWEYRQGWHDKDKVALDIGIKGPNADKRVLAAADGVITSMCRGKLSARVVIDHNGTRLEYWHLDVKMLAPGIVEGQPVVQGQVLGVLLSGPWTKTDDGSPPCGEAPLQNPGSAHLHWVIPNGTITADGWTIQHSSDTWTRGSEVRNPHQCDDCPYDYLPSTNVPSAPVTIQKAGGGSGSVMSSPSGIDCGSDCTGGYPLDSSMTLIAVPNTGSVFAGWSGDCTGSTATCVMAINGSKSVTATFAPQPAPFSLTVTRTGDGSGAVAGQGINCGSDCDETYSSGTTVTLQASPASGSVFSGWSGHCTGPGDCTLTMNGGKSVTASFTRPASGGFGLTVSRSGTGSGVVTSDPGGINCSLDCQEAFPKGTVVTLQAFADPGSIFAGWSACEGTDTCKVTIDSQKTVTATFNPAPSNGLPPGNLIFPTGVINTRTPVFKWQAQDFEASYVVQVWPAGNRRGILINDGPYSKDGCSKTTSICSFQSPSALANGNYVWLLKSYKLGTSYIVDYSDSAEVPFTVAAPRTCNYSPSPETASFGADGGDGSLALQTGTGCPWNVSSNFEWIKVSENGQGSRSFGYHIQPNCSPSARSGSILISNPEDLSGQLVPINQAGNNTFTVGQYDPNDTYNIVSGQWRTGDFNGDGKTDLVHLTDGDYVHSWFYRSDGKFDVGQFTFRVGYNIRSGTWLTGDFNADGRTDLAHVTDDEYVNLWFSNGDGTFNEKRWRAVAGYNTKSGRWLAGDLNGDGRTDLIHLPDATYMHSWLSRGDGTFDVGRFDPAEGGYAVYSGSFIAGDFNGDHKTDLIHFVNRDYVHVWLSNGDGRFTVLDRYSPWAGYDFSLGSWLTGDFNGDGHTDLVHITGLDYVHVWLAGDHGDFTVGKFSPMSGYATSMDSWLVADIDGDGKTDLVHIVGGNYVHPWLSKGDGTFVLSTFCPMPGYNGSLGWWVTADLNGDHKTDLVHLVQAHYVHPWISGADQTTYRYGVGVPGVAPCPGCPVGPNQKVWANTTTRRYHCTWTRYYGNTKQGSYMTQKQAQDMGLRAAYHKICK